jgi:hypothetical protein
MLAPIQVSSCGLTTRRTIPPTTKPAVVAHFQLGWVRILAAGFLVGAGTKVSPLLRGPTFVLSLDADPGLELRSHDAEDHPADDQACRRCPFPRLFAIVGGLLLSYSTSTLLATQGRILGCSGVSHATVAGLVSSCGLTTRRTIPPTTKPAVVAHFHACLRSLVGDL